jgi:hypothetical protein
MLKYGKQLTSRPQVADNNKHNIMMKHGPLQKETKQNPNNILGMVQGYGTLHIICWCGATSC